MRRAARVDDVSAIRHRGRGASRSAPAGRTDRPDASHAAAAGARRARGGLRHVGVAVAALVGVTAGASWLLTGVSIADATLFVVFEAVFVLMPGCTLYVLLSRRPGDGMRILAIGWPLGYALVIGAFAASAATGQRELLALLPVLAAATAVAMLVAARRRAGGGVPALPWRGGGGQGSGRGGGQSDGQAGIVIAGCALALGMVVLALECFARYPLPGHAASVAYQADNVFDISLAAEALHHWPLMEPYVAGQPLHYYTGFFLYAAGIGQVTGVSLAASILRLFPTTVTIVIAIQLWVLGRDLGRSSRVGALAVVLFFCVNSLNLNALGSWGFPRAPFSELFGSPTYALGIVLLLPVCMLVRAKLLAGAAQSCAPAASGPARADQLGSLAMAGILVLAGTAVKAPATVTLLGGLGLFWLWRVVVARDLRLSSYLVVATVCAAIVYHFLLDGGVASAAVLISPLAFVRNTVFFTAFPAHTIAGYALLACAAAIVLLVLFAPSAGALWLLRRRERDSQFIGFCLAIFLAGILVYTILDLSGGSQLWFMSYGAVVMIPVVALGLSRLWDDTPPRARSRVVRACLLAMCLGLLLAGSAPLLELARRLLGERKVPSSSEVGVSWYLAVYALVAIAVLVVSVKLAPYYATVARSHPSRIFAGAAPLLATFGVASTLGLAVHELWDTISGRQVSVDSRAYPGMTASLYRGLSWVRAHTSPCDILAVNFHGTTNDDTSLYFYYSAFTEREVFLESWTYTPQGAAQAHPFARKLALNDLAVVRGDPAALEELTRQGVSYVLIDKDHGAGVREPADVSRLVFSDSALDVYRLVGGGAGTDRAGASCAATRRFSGRRAVARSASTR
jgi:hypothetical protein